MKLLWKLLRQHISIGQFTGFVFANLFGMIILIAGFQFYEDVLPVFTSEDSFMKADYLMVTKHVGLGSTLSGNDGRFSDKDIAQLKSQPFIKKLGLFTSTNYKIDAQLSISGINVLNTEMSFESVPDEFVIDSQSQVNGSCDTVGVQTSKLRARSGKQWQWKEGDKVVPIILPRTYISMYNFGYAQSHGLPQVSDNLVSSIKLQMQVHGGGKEGEYLGKVVSLSNSMTTVLVPQSFMDYTNKLYAPEDITPTTRLLIEVNNPADEQVTQYMENHGLEIESDKLQQEKQTYFLKLVVSLVMVIGVIISSLSFYILMLSIYLLVQKNTEKLQNLLLIGYSPARVALPYQLLTAGLNIGVLIIAIAVIVCIRTYYMAMIENVYPETSSGTILPSVVLGIGLFCVVTLLNVVIIRRKISRI